MSVDTFRGYIKLISVLLISGLYLIFSDSLINDIISIYLLFFGAVIIVKFNIAHPYVWYGFFFSLYATGYPLLVYLNASPLQYGYSQELTYLHWVAFATFLVVVNPKVVNIRKIKENVTYFDNKVSKYLFYILSFLVLVYLVFLSTQGYTSKQEINSSGSIIIVLGMRLILIYLLISSIELIKGIYQTNKMNYINIIITFSMMLFLFIYSAERDLLLRFVLIVFFIYYIFLYNSRHKIKLLLIVTALFLIVPISRSVKFLGMRGETLSLGNNILIDFLNSEFHTQARNVQVILNYGNLEGYFQGSTLISSFTKLIGFTDVSLINWFHETFYATRTTGMGFSLVAEGYVNLGYIGIVIIFFVIGIIVNYIYINSVKSIYNLVIYLMMIPISIYTIRADLYNFSSQYTKQVLLVILVMKILDIITAGKKKRSDNTYQGSVLGEVHKRN